MPDTSPDQPLATLPDAHRVVIVDDVDGRVFDESSRYEHGAVVLVQDGGRTVKIFPAPEGQSTPSAEDNRLAHEWASDASPSWGPRALAAVRAIKAHVPAPPKSLADELRKIIIDVEHHDMDSSPDGRGTWQVRDATASLRALADRAEAVEVENVSLRIERDQADYLMQKADRERDEARAKVERLTSGRTSKESLPVATAPPDPADVPEGTHWLIAFEGECYEARRNSVVRVGHPWSFIREGAPCSATDSEVTLVARLVPEGPATFKETLKEPGHLPEPVDVPDGEAWFVVVDGEHRVGIRCESAEDYQVPWATSPAADSAWWVSDDEITLVARLVPATRRVIDTVEGLDALPAGSVVIDKDGVSWQHRGDGRWYGRTSLARTSGLLIGRCGPVTVIYVPEVTA